MLQKYLDKDGISEHHLFQEWREKNPAGVFLTIATKQNANLHGARCLHLGSGPPYYRLDDHNSSLTRKWKICGPLNELLAWARKGAITINSCQHCVRDGFIPENIYYKDTQAHEQIADGPSLPVQVSGVTKKPSLTEIERDFNEKVLQAQSLSSDERRRRLAATPNIPQKVEVTTTTFVRNQYVVAEALIRAGGTCERCKRPAPFNRASDGTPYLEVHHKKRLADGGEDSVNNAVALCPNCHRHAHYA